VSFDVIVVGSREAGASTAMLLARWRVLDAAGESNAPPTRRLRLTLAGVELEGNFPSVDGVDVLLSPRRRVLDNALVEAARASGGHVRENYVVADLVWENGRVVGISGNDRGQPPVVERAPLVIGADGKHSLVAKSAKARIPAKPEVDDCCLLRLLLGLAHGCGRRLSRHLRIHRRSGCSGHEPPEDCVVEDPGPVRRRRVRPEPSGDMRRSA